MIDSHTHLTMFAEGERAEVLSRAVESGLSRVLVPATGPEDVMEVVKAAEQFPNMVVAAVGFHPHEARHLNADWKRRITGVLSHPSVVAVGEIGLDYHYQHSPIEDQRQVFRWQLELAREAGLPVVLHHREAWDDFLDTLDGVPGVRGVAHSFTEGAAGVRDLTDRGYHIGISGMVTFPRGTNVREAAVAVPRGRLLLETDSPYLAPVPHRGRRNEPALIPLVLNAVASARAEDPDQVERTTDAAFSDLFGLVSVAVDP